MDINENEFKISNGSKNKKEKKYVFLFILLILVAIMAIFYLLNGNNNLKANVLGIPEGPKLKKVASFSTKGSNSNALQGSTGYNNKIYFSTSKSGPSNQSKYYSSIMSNDVKTGKTTTMNPFDKILNKIPTYKVNDIVTNTDLSRNYYIAYDATNKKNSKIIFSINNIERQISLSNRISNIAYNKNNKKYYSLGGTKIYKFEIPSVDKSNTKENLGSIKVSKACNIVRKKNIISQGITMNGNLLFFSYQTHPSSNEYANYIDVYDIRNCNTRSTIKPSQTVSLGKCKANSNVNNCELESLFYMNSKLYLGYNNSLFNGINFYTLNFPSKSIESTLKIKKIKNGKVTLQANANSKLGKIYGYKFCTNKDGSGCSYSGYKNILKKYVMKKDITINKTISDVNKDWYFIVMDVFGNETTSKISKSELQSTLKK